MPKKNNYTAINIQYPISQKIIYGEKKIETRKYALPNKYLDKELLLMETPGKTQQFKSRIIAIIKFTECFQYQNKKQFYAQENLHCVSKNSDWAWQEGEKWGWRVEVIKIIQPAITFLGKKGIVYTNNIII